jgi:hypothetical protein
VFLAMLFGPGRQIAIDELAYHRTVGLVLGLENGPSHAAIQALA